jgi:hypothetical protein
MSSALKIFNSPTLIKNLRQQVWREYTTGLPKENGTFPKKGNSPDVGPLAFALCSPRLNLSANRGNIRQVDTEEDFSGSALATTHNATDPMSKCLLQEAYSQFEFLLAEAQWRIRAGTAVYGVPLRGVLPRKARTVFETGIRVTRVKSTGSRPSGLGLSLGGTVWRLQSAMRAESLRRTMLARNTRWE